jgi:hypothetical protein
MKRSGLNDFWMRLFSTEGLFVVGFFTSNRPVVKVRMALVAYSDRSHVLACRRRDRERGGRH